MIGSPNFINVPNSNIFCPINLEKICCDRRTDRYESDPLKILFWLLEYGLLKKPNLKIKHLDKVISPSNYLTFSTYYVKTEQPYYPKKCVRKKIFIVKSI